jgi:cytoskeletal protein CcmA (bactofilin family)
MARRTDALGVTGADTVIGPGVIVTGTLDSEGDMYIDGSVTGEIKAIGDVTIGINAVIKANIAANNVTVGGSLEGDIRAQGEASITESGQVHGNIHATGLSISNGGQFEGTNRVLSTRQLELPAEDEA